MRKTKSPIRPEARTPMRGRFSGRRSHAAGRGRRASFRATPEFFSLVIDSLAEYAVLTVDRGLTIGSWNPASERIFGYAKDEIVGTSIAALFTEEDRENGYPQREFDEALAKGRVEDVRYHRKKGGATFWSYGLAFPLRDARGGVRGYVKIVRDESERKRNEDALRENEERLRLAVEATGMGTWDYTPRSGTLKVCEGSQAIFGVAPGAPATYDAFLTRVHSDDRERVAAAIAACLDGREPVCDVEFRVTPPNGSQRWAIIKAKMLSPRLPGDREDDRRMIGLVVDSTCKKQFQLEAASLTAALDQRVKDRTASLLLANEELESFAYAASHDLRAPLRKIQAYCQAILETESGALSAKGQGYLKKTRAAAASMNTLIDATLNLSLATRKTMTRQDVDLSAMALEIADDLRRSEPGRATRIDVAPGLSAQGDPDLLALALRNLLDNAWKATRDRAEGLIEFGSTRKPEGDVFFVRDNGVGFDMEHADKLFRPFERLHEASEFSGTGVGLGIVRRVVRRHLGRVWAEGKLGQGATFSFTLFTEAL